MIKTNGTRFSVVLALTALLVGPAMFQARAEDPIPTNVNTADVKEYIATWLVAPDIMGRKFELFLTIADVDGKIGATLDSKRQPEALAIAEVELTDEGLRLSGELKFGRSFTIDITFDVHVEDGKLVGTMKDKGGIFKADFIAEQMTAQELDSVQGRRPPPTEARMTIDGKRVRIAFADLSMDTSDWELFKDVKNGEVFKYTLSRATKIYTDIDMVFGDTIVKSENMAENYPGVYSLWLKRVGKGWSLIFNSSPDTWGTRHDPELDVAEIPLEVRKIKGDPQETFLVKLDREGEEEAIMTMSWGNLEWSAKFGIVQ